MDLEFLRDFFPSGPLTTLYAMVMLSITVSVLWISTRGLYKDIAGLLFLSWPLALTATALESTLFQASGTALIAWLLFRMQEKLATIIFSLCGLKMLAYSANVAGMLNWEQMWAASEVVAYLQLLALLGGAVTHGRTMGYHLGHWSFRRWISDLVVSCTTWCKRLGSS